MSYSAGFGLLFLPLLGEDTDLSGEYSAMNYSYTRASELTSCQAPLLGLRAHCPARIPAPPPEAEAVQVPCVEEEEPLGSKSHMLL